MIGVILVRCGECGDLALDPRSGTCQTCVGAGLKARESQTPHGSRRPGPHHSAPGGGQVREDPVTARIVALAAAVFVLTAVIAAIIGRHVAQLFDEIARSIS